LGAKRLAFDWEFGNVFAIFTGWLAIETAFLALSGSAI
jgi:hypothetical protein